MFIKIIFARQASGVCDNVINECKVFGPNVIKKMAEILECNNVIDFFGYI